MSADSVTIQAQINLLRVRNRIALAKSRGPRTAYVRRDVLNGADIVAHYKAQGFDTLLDPADMHITLVYSKVAFDWFAAPEVWAYGSEGNTGHIVIAPGGQRALEVFGSIEEPCVVMRVRSDALEWRQRQLIDAGAFSKFDTYAPHVTLTYRPGGIDVSEVEPYQGAIVLGPEIWEEIDGEGWSASEAVEKAGKGGRPGSDYARHPAGSSKGGQFASKPGAGGPSAIAGASGGPQMAWGGAFGAGGPKKPLHAIEKPGSVAHPARDDDGNPVFVHRPTKAGDPKAWGSKGAVATILPGDKASVPAELNGVAFKSWAGVTDWTKVPGTKPELEAGMPDLQAGHKRAAAGVLIEEADGRVWLTRPTNGFGGYQHTFPKGGQEKGLTLQQTAVKEAWEETGLKIEITGVFGDFERTTSVGRYYTAKRVGGHPADMGWESQALRLVPRKKLRDLLNHNADHDIMDAWDAEDSFTKVAPSAFLTPAGIAHLAALIAPDITKQTPIATPAPLDHYARTMERADAILKALGKGSASGGSWSKQPRWPSGSPLGGQWKGYDAAGLVKPPKIGSAANPQYQKKADALYGLASSDGVALAKAALGATDIVAKGAEADAKGASGAKLNSNDKWKQQLAQYASALIGEAEAKSKADALDAGKAAAEAQSKGDSAPLTIEAFKKNGPKPGGSNPGMVATGPDGAKWLIKGSNNPSKDGAQAHNEVLASKLLEAAGVGVPVMQAVDLKGQFGGGTGVASKMIDGGIALGSMNTESSVYKNVVLKAVQADFAVHAWLANYDAIGLSKDNTMIVTGNGPAKAVNIDPGGALMFRAQGAAKYPSGKMPHDVVEWQSMRMPVSGVPVNAAAHAVYGTMTASDLKASAQKLAAVTPDQIKAIVDGYAGPMDKKMLSDALIARRDFILKAAGITNETAPNGAYGAPKVSENGVSKPVRSPSVPQGAGPQAAKPSLIGSLGQQAQAVQAINDAKAAFKAGNADALDKIITTHGDLSDAYAGMSIHGFGSPLHVNHGKAADYALELKMELTAKTDTSPTAKPTNVATDVVTGVQQVSAAVPKQPPVFDASALKGSASLKTAFKEEADSFATAYMQGGIPAVKAALQPYVDAANMQSAAGTVFAHNNKVLLDHGNAVIAHLEAREAGKTQPAAVSTPATGAGIAKPVFGGEGSFAGSAAYYTKLTDQMEAAHAKGDMDALVAAGMKAKGGMAWPVNAAGEPKTMAGKQASAYHAALMADLGTKKGLEAVAQAEASVKAAVQEAKGSGVEHKPGDPATPVYGAVPNYEDAKLPSTNTNAASHNAKVTAIMNALTSDKPHDILAMKFGTNTYAKKQVALANDTLAALGSSQKVVAGQAANSHPGLTGGVKPDVAMAIATNAGLKVKPADLQPAKAPVVPHLDAAHMPQTIDYLNAKGPGQGLSSKAWVNQQNAELQDKMIALAKAGDYATMATLTYPEVHKETGLPTGKVLPVSQHPAKGLQAFHESAVQAMRDIMYPPKPLRVFDAKAATSIAAITKAFPAKPIATVHANAKSNQKLGYYVALGATQPVEAVTPKASMPIAPAAVKAGKAEYAAMSPMAKAFIANIQASGAMGAAFKAGQKDYNGQSMEALAKAAHAAAVQRPAGTEIYKWINATQIETLVKQPKGTVLQSAACMCASYDPNATAGFGNSRITFVHAEGAKTLSTHGSGAFAGEKEISVLPNSRFVLLDAKHNPGKKPQWDVRLLLLPPDPTLDG